jgi:Transposase, Mutator family
MLTVVPDPGETAASTSVLDELVREGARRMLAAALEAEVSAYVEAHVGEVDEHGRRLVVRNGHAEARQVMTAAGAVEVVAPRVNDKRADEANGERHRFTSAILPPWCRKSPRVAEVLPLLYLHGLSSQDFGPALEQFLGSSAGLSASVITKLTVQWRDEARAFQARDLSGVDYVYVWADGIVRHEALHDRVGGGRPSPPGCRGSRVEAEGSLIRGTPGRVESRPDNAGTCWHCQTVRVRQARREGVREKPACKAPQSALQLEPGGSGLGCGAHRPGRDPGAGTPGRDDAFRLEATVKAHGVVVAMPLGQSWTPRSVDR